MFKNHTLTLAFIFLITFSIYSVNAEKTSSLNTNVNSRVFPTTYSLLMSNHYSPKSFNDEFFEILYDDIIKSLDPHKTLFTKEQYLHYKSELQDTLLPIYQHSDHRVLDDFYNYYREQHEESRLFYLDYIKNITLDDFNTEKHYYLDYENRSFANDSQQLNNNRINYIKFLMINELANEEETLDSLKNVMKIQFTDRRNPMSYDKFIYNFLNKTAKLFDTHSAFLSPNEAESFSIDMTGKLQGGVGIVLNEDKFGRIIAYDVLDNGPTGKTNKVENGYVLTGFHNKKEEFISTKKLSLNDVVNYLRGEKGTKISLYFEDDSENEIKVTVVRDTLDIASSDESLNVQFELKTYGENDIGFFKIPSFYDDFNENGRNVADDFNRLLTENHDDMDGMIIDVRNNGGGSLRAVIKMMGHFIPGHIVTQIGYPDGNIEQQHAPDNLLHYDKPLLVMVNGQSASASEIFAAAIQDYKKGIVIGEETFGKGSVQQLLQLGKNNLKLTTSKFFRPSGKSVQEKGVVPDIDIITKYPQTLLGERSLDNHMKTSVIDYNNSEFLSSNNIDDVISDINNYVNNNSSEAIEIMNSYFELINEFQYKKDSVSLNLNTRKNNLEHFEEQSLSLINEYQTLISKPTFDTYSDYLESDTLLFSEALIDYSMEILNYWLS